MPITYQIHQGKGLIRTKCYGAVSLEEVIDHFHQLKEDPNCPARLDVLLDLSEQTSIPKKENLRDVAGEIGRIRDTVQFGACAIVACKDALFGMSRMFEVFTEQLFSESYVFRSLQEAETWLASQHPSTSASSGDD